MNTERTEPLDSGGDLPAAGRAPDEARTLRVVDTGMNDSPALRIGILGCGPSSGLVLQIGHMLRFDPVFSRPTGSLVAPGDGAVDLPGFVAAPARSGFDGPLVAHGFGADDTARAGRALNDLCLIRP